MRPLARIAQTRRAISDLARCMTFIGLQPWGKPRDREQEILRAFERIRRAPEYFRIEARRGGVELRRYGVSQFMIIYAYFLPSERHPNGIVSIRAVRHRRERDWFQGVREPAPPSYYGAALV